MFATTPRRFTWLVLVVSALAAVPLWGSIGGERRFVVYEGADGEVTLRIVLDPTLTRLQSITGTHLSIPVQIENGGDRAWTLDSADTLKLEHDGGVMTGHFDLRKVDRAVAQRVREAGFADALDYPAEVPAAEPPEEEGERPRPTEMTVFALFKVTGPLKSMPSQITYTVAGKDVTIERERPRAN